MRMADTPNADQIVSGEMYCATIGNVGMTNQLIAAKRHSERIIHLIIVLPFVYCLTTVSRWNIAFPLSTESCSLHSKTRLLPLVDGTELRSHCNPSCSTHTVTCDASCQRRTVLALTILTLLVDGTPRIVSCWHVCCKVCTNHTITTINL